MKKKIMMIFLILFTSLILSGCFFSKSGPILKKPDRLVDPPLSFFEPKVESYDPSTVSPLIPPKTPPVTQNLVIIFDSSLTMNNPYDGLSKIQHARLILEGLNNALPEIPLRTIIYKLSTCPCQDDNSVEVVFPFADHDRQDVSSAIIDNRFAPSDSALANSLNLCKEELSSIDDNIAVVIITDGNTFDASPIQAAQNLYHEFGAKIGIYPILIGDSSWGKRLVHKMADQSVSGFVQCGDCLLDNDCMHNFVHKIIFDPPYKNWDRDGDGIKDQFDSCPKTPEGNVVDSTGCSPDTDGDNISDDRDECPGTPSGTTVESNGCPPKDRDNDGVLDKEDQCLDTPSWAIVNPDGCKKPDQDQDGILDINDDCIDTPPGASINSRGCWVISDLQFASGKWELDASHKNSLKEVVDIMKQHPDLRIEIQGHTDKTGPEGLNKRLSSYRAMSVMKFLIKNGIKTYRLTFMGYGSEKPVIKNESSKNRYLNRRIEFNPK